MKDQLRAITKAEAIAQWQTRWEEAPRLQPAYLALSAPPDGKIPGFVRGLAKHSRLIFSTGIRLLTTHAFTGEYAARLRPTSNDPHHCECGEPLQTANHVLSSCPRQAAARQQHILSIPNIISLSHIQVFGTEEDGEALGAFIAPSQACARPRRQDPLTRLRRTMGRGEGAEGPVDTTPPHTSIPPTHNAFSHNVLYSNQPGCTNSPRASLYSHTCAL